MNKIRNFAFKWRKLKVTGAGRAEVERFLLHCLSQSLLVGFILSDSSHLQKISPNSLSSLQRSRRLWDLAGACYSCCSQEPPGVSGDVCTHVPSPASPAQLPLSPRSPQGKDLSLWHPGHLHHTALLTTPWGPQANDLVPSLKTHLHFLGFSCLHSS